MADRRPYQSLAKPPKKPPTAAPSVVMLTTASLSQFDAATDLKLRAMNCAMRKRTCAVRVRVRIHFRGAGTERAGEERAQAASTPLFTESQKARHSQQDLRPTQRLRIARTGRAMAMSDES